MSLMNVKLLVSDGWWSLCVILVCVMLVSMCTANGVAAAERSQKSLFQAADIGRLDRITIVVSFAYSRNGWFGVIDLYVWFM